jgi:hypothetical protein
MRRLTLQKASLASLLSLVVVFSFAAAIQLEKNNFLSSNAISHSTSSLDWNHFGFLVNPALAHYAPLFSDGQIVLENVVKESPVSPISNSITRIEVYDFICC